jgi:hypothetical protein
MLICVPSCSAPDCADVLYIDFGVACDGSEYRQGLGAAAATLGLFSLAAPLFLLRTARRSVAARDAALHLRYTDMSRWFDELDADGSGVLDEGELKQLFVRMVGAALRAVPSRRGRGRGAG